MVLPAPPLVFDDEWLRAKPLVADRFLKNAGEYVAATTCVEGDDHIDGAGGKAGICHYGDRRDERGHDL